MYKKLPNKDMFNQSLTIIKMKTAVCFLFLVLFGSSFGYESRVIGGQSANIESYPYQISMRWTYGSPKPQHFCGGSIVSPNHIVTAAHCVQDKTLPGMLKYIQIFTGTSRTDIGGNAYDVKSVHIHPAYIGPINTYLNDIAIVTVSRPIIFDQSQQAVKLPTRDVQNGAIAVITGWGLNRHGSNDLPKQMQKMSTRLVVSSQCQRHLPFALTNTQVCAIQTRGVGVCSGDSGGPLVSNGELVGVASYVVECAKGHPDVYTNVYSHLNFIRQIVN